jgi:chromosomal replication initiation ATPase DnaA
LLSAVFVKLFSDRQLIVKPSLVRFILRRCARSYAAAKELVERIDQEALALQRAPTRSFVSELMQRSEANH